MAARQRDRELWENANTIAAGIRVPVAVGDFLIIRAINESDGFAISVSDNEIVEARDFVSKTEGTLLCPEGALLSPHLKNL